ncbi:23S rRNA m(5)U-1939 methyltransferase [Celeribacter marinus]|uniref:23S rRNA (Uracil-5-)-methyltransferase RumA n=1 Tax=Celeribacter marinus TaxID=1397108 RepID=A0A0P0ABR1_9RHOB|nr:23S rRNA (Uracil-5-) -methyltransferase RumA [Celeribacter marinus]SFL04858.1 23S rRNA m(5)U-1939 methyltransferase [Celeribacter marinus]
MVQLTIERLGHQGDGIGQGPIYAAQTLPGEVVEGDIVDGRMSKPRILTPSEDRVKAPCRHYSVCGGCSLQHASDDFVSNWKRDVVVTALKHQGIFAKITAVHTSPPQSRRRAVFHGKRTKNGAHLGLFGRASDILHDIPSCKLMSASIMSGFETLRSLVVLGATRRGHMTLTVTEVAGGLDVSVENGKDLDLKFRSELASFVPNSGLIRLVWQGEVIAQNGLPYQLFGSAKVVPPAGAFLQATSHGEAVLVDAMRRAVGDAKSVVDLFAGCGTFSMPLAQTARVHAVEDVREMMEALAAGWREALGLKQVTTETRDLFRRPLLPDELAKFEAVVIDPPRAGAAAQIAELAKSEIGVIGFVSCNPVTFARDARVLLDAGFVLDWLEVVDQFRWSSHVEVAARFARMS